MPTGTRSPKAFGAAKPVHFDSTIERLPYNSVKPHKGTAGNANRLCGGSTMEICDV
jgi:hypothetical protein